MASEVLQFLVSGRSALRALVLDIDAELLSARPRSIERVREDEVPLVDDGTAPEGDSREHGVDPGRESAIPVPVLRASGGATPMYVDVRSAGERAAGSIPGSEHVPLSEIWAWARGVEVPTGVVPVFFCTSGGRARQAVEIWTKLRLEIRAESLAGGAEEWPEHVPSQVAGGRRQ
jgi:adenylyltransferase/sulfurtransferase